MDSVATRSRPWLALYDASRATLASRLSFTGRARRPRRLPRPRRPHQQHHGGR
ncbi:hypothetical protein ACFQY4_15500 [Catellatospora bangladeshensis]|uniref:Uncharacterized protein n=1 Tax=Catellatospora bangladeshensis TaxID=310355 RepID=A0A8J3NKH1_9ACTN|nr:hypothetical protein [Catellatospora bangladeshensis]GIF82993.1 hypothetical protein Cba03nite_43420 [Catellatospora bangladeshensis]